MSVKIVQKPLPAGVVPYEEIADPTMKQKVMLLNRNIASLAAQLAEVQRAAIELQQRPMPKQKEIADIERYVAQANAAAERAEYAARTAEWSLTFVLSHQRALGPENGTFPHVVDMSAIVPYPTLWYDVVARFFCTYTSVPESPSKRYFKIGDGDVTEGLLTRGFIATATCMASGNDVIGVINGSTSYGGGVGSQFWDTMITICEHRES